MTTNDIRNQFDKLIDFFRWTKDHAPVKLSDRKLLAGGSLLLKSVTADDTGVYVCRINNSIWSKAIHVTLTIPHSLMVHINPQHLLVDSGSSVALRCVTSAPQVSETGRSVVRASRRVAKKVLSFHKGSILNNEF